MPGVTRIGVVADTHDRVPEKLLALLGSADQIWHLGDVCSPGILSKFQALGKPLRLVRGNCDSHMAWPLHDDFVEGGHRIRLVHIPPHAAPPTVEILLHGHTHRPRSERIGPTLFLNPGCVTRPNQGAPRSFAWLTLAEEQSPDWEIVLL